MLRGELTRSRANELTTNETNVEGEQSLREICSECLAALCDTDEWNEGGSKVVKCGVVQTSIPKG